MKYMCLNCKTEYHSSSGTPPGIKWNDGHICKPILVKETKKELKQQICVPIMYQQKCNLYGTKQDKM